MKTLASLLCGAAASAALILACSDDSPGDADAAVCDCPAAEAPIPPRLQKVRGLDSTLSANTRTSAFATCPANSTLMTGHCIAVDNAGTPPQAALRQFGPSDPDPKTWLCVWDNLNLGTAVIHAEAVCLVP